MGLIFFAMQGWCDDIVGEYRLVYCFDTFDVSVTFSITQEMLP